jgi:hypothetical protein
MNKNILFLVLINWLAMGCAAQMLPDSPGPPGTGTCTSYTMKTCTGDKRDPHVTIDLDAKTVDPECVKAKKGRAIIFKLQSASPITKGSVEIIAKDSSNDWWLAGSNSPNKNRILVLAPKKKEDGSFFSSGKRFYKIKTDTWCIDPRVDVKN